MKNFRKNPYESDKTTQWEYFLILGQNIEEILNVTFRNSNLKYKRLKDGSFLIEEYIRQYNKEKITSSLVLAFKLVEYSSEFSEPIYRGIAIYSKLKNSKNFILESFIENQYDIFSALRNILEDYFELNVSTWPKIVQMYHRPRIFRENPYAKSIQKKNQKKKSQRRL